MNNLSDLIGSGATIELRLTHGATGHAEQGVLKNWQFNRSRNTLTLDIDTSNNQERSAFDEPDDIRARDFDGDARLRNQVAQGGGVVPGKPMMGEAPGAFEKEATRPLMGNSRLRFESDSETRDLADRMEGLGIRGMAGVIARHDVAEFKLRKRVEELEARSKNNDFSRQHIRDIDYLKRRMTYMQGQMGEGRRAIEEAVANLISDLNTRKTRRQQVEEAHGSAINELDTELQKSNSLIKTLFAMIEKQNVNIDNLGRAHNEINDQLNRPDGIRDDLSKLAEKVYRLLAENQVKARPRRRTRKR